MSHFICSISHPNRELERDLTSKTYMLLEYAHWRRLLHKYIEAFAGLDENMAGLRFSYAHKFGADMVEQNETKILLTITHSTMKKLLSLLFVTLLPMLSNAYDAKIDGIYYNFISENEAEVTYRLLRRASYSGVVVIPKTVTYNGKTYRVTGIGDNAFYGCTDLTSAICLFGDSLAYNKNLIENGDFSSGYNGFTSDYSYISEPGNMALYGEGKFAVGTSPRLYFEGFIEHVDHTTGTGNMLIANGSPDNRVYVWKKKVLVEKGKTYEFSTWYIKINTGGNSFKEDIE